MHESSPLDLIALGWGDHFAAAMAPQAAAGRVPGRVIGELRQQYEVMTAAGPVRARVSGRFRHETQGIADFPAVGDWVALDPRPEEGSATIHALLPRKTAFSRKNPGNEAVEQVIVANLDRLFLVAAVDATWNPRRLERFLAMSWESGAMPVVVLTKLDLIADPEARLEEARAVAPGAPVHLVSNLTGANVEELRSYFATGVTAALIGSSGVGKSSLINRLLGTERQLTGSVRAADGKGRHTTTRRELLFLPGGGLIIDTPGIRGLELWDAGTGLDETFDDLARLGENCRFGDCAHEVEPGCAIRAAVDAGEVEADRYESYLKLRREARALERRVDVRARLAEKRRVKTIMKEVNRRTRGR